MPRKKVIKDVETHVPVVPKVAAYLRVSTDEQADSGLGLAAQKTRCEAMATFKAWPSPVYYEDAGVSGAKAIEKRPALLRLMEDVRAGQIDIVIILSIDRLARNTRIVLTIAEEFRKRNVNLASCKENVDTTTPQGYLFFTLTAAFATFERDLASERTTDALRERGRINGEKGGRVPYGYLRIFAVNDRNENKSIGVQIEDEQAGVVRYIFDLRLSRRFSMKAIADALNKKYPISPRGGEWYASGVREILLNEQDYRGGLRGNSPIVWPAILRTEEARA